MAVDVGVLTQGKLPQGIEYSTPWSPSSPWSLVLAFMPETVTPKQYVGKLDSAPPSAKGEQLDIDVASFCQKNNAELGWVESGSTSAEEIAQQFMQVRLRQQDAASGSIKWDSSSKYVASKWYNGIVRPLTLLRDSYHSVLSLAQFEAMSVEGAFGQLTAPITPANASHVVKYILEPWCEYTQHQDQLKAWAAQLPLEISLRLTNIPSLTSSLVDSCYLVPFDSKRLMELSDRLGNDELKKDVEAGIVLHSQTLDQVRKLKNGSEQDKKRMVDQLVLSFPSPMVGIWEALEKLPLPSESVEPVIVRELIHRGQFETLQSKRYSRDLVQTMALESLKTPSQTDIKSMIGASALLQDQSYNKRLTAVAKLESQYSLNSKETLESSGKQVLDRVLLLNQRAYQHKDLIDTINLATSQDLDENYALSQLVEFALVDNNFNAAVQFCAKLDQSSVYSWLAYLQSAKYRPSYSETVPPKIHAKQKELVVTCLQICPPTDIEGVLRVYNALHAAPSAAPPAAPSATPSAATARGVEPEPSRSASPDTARKRNLFVSSLGWAIGAPTD